VNYLRAVLRVRRKGVLILPKRIRETSGINEGDEVLVEAREGVLVVRPLRPRVVDVDLSLVEELLGEEYRLEGGEHGEMLES